MQQLHARLLDLAVERGFVDESDTAGLINPEASDIHVTKEQLFALLDEVAPAFSHSAWVTLVNWVVGKRKTQAVLSKVRLFFCFVFCAVVV